MKKYEIGGFNEKINYLIKHISNAFVSYKC